MPTTTDSPTDIWEDPETLTFLKSGVLPIDRSAAARVRKRVLLFRWFNNRLFKVVKDQGTGNLAHRIVPEPKERDELILTMHKDLGHVGEKRTIAAMSQVYWWHGMTVDVRRLVSTCSLCDRVQASPPAGQQEMQTEPHDYGLFYRWGLDYVGELTPSAQGNKHALVFIDYYSKWIEVFPVPKADAVTTVRLVLLNLVARYGTSAEVICDNGSPFQAEFAKFCATRHINLRYITPGLPRSNGLAERAVQTVKHALQKHAAEKHSASTWDTEGLASILLGYRVTPQASTGCLQPKSCLHRTLQYMQIFMPPEGPRSIT
jgi:Integrase core domain.